MKVRQNLEKVRSKVKRNVGKMGGGKADRQGMVRQKWKGRK